MSNENTRAALSARRNGNGGDPYQAPPSRNAGNGNGGNGNRYPNRSQQAAPVNVAPYVPPLNRRKPTGKVSSPFILVEGGEKVGKSWSLATLSASPRVGESLWLDLSEGGADEYGAVPGARYEVLEHDGSWREIMGQIRAAHAYAREARERGDKPVCLFIDSGSLIWLGLSRWAEDSAKRSPAGQAVLRSNADADVTITVTHWNAAGNRWRDMMNLLMTYPGIVVMTARGKWVTAIGEDGKPVKNAPKEYKVEGQRDLCYDATAHVRLNRDGTTTVVGARSVHAGIRPGKDPERKLPEGGFTLDWFIFDVLKFDPNNTQTRDLKHLNGDDGEAHEESERAKAAAAARPGGQLVDPDPNERAAGSVLGAPVPETEDHENTDGDNTRPEDAPEDVDPFTAALEAQQRQEKEAAAFAEYAGLVLAASNKPTVIDLWHKGVNAGWMERPTPGGRGTVRQVLEAATAQIRAQAEKAGV